MFSPTGYYAHYGTKLRGAKNDSDREYTLVHRTLPVVSFEESARGTDYAMVCAEDGRLERASGPRDFLRVTASPEG